MHANTTQAEHTAYVDHHIQIALDSAIAEGRSGDGYLASPTPKRLIQHQDFASDVESALESVVRFGSTPDRNSAIELLRMQQDYMTGAAEMFTAAAVNRHGLALAIDRSKVEPRLAALQQKLHRQEATQFAAAEAASRRLTIAQDTATQITLALSFAGVACLAIFLFILEKYRRRIFALHREEISRLEQAALIDNLTQLGNHRAFQEDLHRETSRAKRYGENLSLALIDLDELKAINDLNGHQRGDEVLGGLAGLLRRLRAEDRAYRIGGDEFAVLLSHSSTVDAEVVMRRLHSDVRANLTGVTVSIGISSLATADSDNDIMRSQADAALYAAKRGGRDTVDVFDEAKDGMWMLSPIKVRSFRELIVEADVGVAFQPIWDVGRCNVLAYEALARPALKYGFAGPQEAFDIAERLGRTHELDAICCRAILKRSHELPSDSLLFINLCPQTLDRGDIDGPSLSRLVTEAGFTPSQVVVEITEKSVGQLDRLIKAATELRRFGFRLALDDTGAGNSGLELLSKLPVDYVKIDRMIVLNALSDVGSRGVLAGIIAIARAIGAYVIAEGIETEEMLEMVCSSDTSEAARQRGVNGVQGYLLRRPSEYFPEAETLEGVGELLRRVGTEHTQKQRIAAVRPVGRLKTRRAS